MREDRIFLYPRYTEEEVTQVIEFATRTGLKIIPMAAGEAAYRADGTKRRVAQPCSGMLWGSQHADRASATSDPVSLQKLFAHDYGPSPSAGRFAFPCWANDLLVVDLDVTADGDGVADWQRICENNGIDPADFPVYQTTPSGGRHIPFSLKNSDPLLVERIRPKVRLAHAGRALSIDIKIGNSLITSDLPGRSGYEWHGDWANVPDAPAWLLRFLANAESEGKGSGDLSASALLHKNCPQVFDQGAKEDGVNYLCEVIKSFSPGERNQKLFSFACEAVRLCGKDDALLEETKKKLLDSAIAIGLPSGEAMGTITSACETVERDEVGRPEKRGFGLNSNKNFSADSILGAEKGRYKKFPYEVFSPRLQRMIRELAAGHGSAPEIVFGNFLALASGCINGKRAIVLEPGAPGCNPQWTEHANLYTLIIMEPSAGKTHVRDDIFEELEKVEREALTAWRQDRAEWEAARWKYDSYHSLSSKERSKKDEPDEPGPKPKMPCIFLKDFTLEAANERFEDNPQGLLVSRDEMADFFKVIGQYTKAGPQNTINKIAELYSRGSYKVSRRSHDGKVIEISVPASLSIFGNIQPRKLDTIFSDDGQGVAQRFICIRGIMDYIPKKPLPKISREVRNDLINLTRRLWNDIKWDGVNTEPLEMTPAGMDLFNDFYNLMQERFFYDECFSFVKKFIGNTGRIILVLDCMERAIAGAGFPKKIDEQAVLRGLKVSEWLFSIMWRVYLHVTKKARLWDTETDAAMSAVCKVINGHLNEIKNAEVYKSGDGRIVGHKIPNSTWKKWLHDAKQDFSDKAFAPQLKNLQVQSGRSKSGRFKIFSELSLSKAKEAFYEAPTIFERIFEDHQQALAEGIITSLPKSDMLLSAPLEEYEPKADTAQQNEVSDYTVHSNALDKATSERLRNTPRDLWTEEDHRIKLRSLLHVEYDGECDENFDIPPEFLPKRKDTSHRLYMVKGKKTVYVFSWEGRREFADIFAYYQVRGCIDLPPVTMTEIEAVSSESALAELDESPKDYSNPHGFTHLHLHTDGSFQDAMLTVAEAVAQAKKCNMPALAITDHGNLHNSRNFYKASLEAGIKPVLGCEIYVKNDLFPTDKKDDSCPTDKKDRSCKSFHLTLLAETQEGWQNLLAIQKHSFDNLYRKSPLVSHDFLASHSKGLIAMSACLGGEIPQTILHGKDPKPVIDWYQKTFGENSFFLEWMENGYAELKKVNPGLFELSRKCGVPLVATADVHYLNPGDREAYLVNSMRDWQLKTNVSVATRGEEPWSLHFKTAEEMRVAHGGKAEALEMAGKIAARCNVELPEPGKGKYFMPPSGTIVGAGKDPAEVLREKAVAGLSAHGLGDKPEYQDRLSRELEIITQKHFESYILMVSDMVDAARRLDILVGPGRGSAAGSLVCYALGITQLDPISNGLLFERFINPDRVSLPDIDVDYDVERREEILDYLRAKYGDDRVVAIGTIGTRKGRTAIDDTARNLQNDAPMLQKDWKDLGTRLSACIPEQCDKTIAVLEKEEAFSGIKAPEACRILKIAARLEGLQRQAGQHACGYVVAADSLENALPVRRTDKNCPLVTQWTKDEIEAAGYVKLDALGSRALTRIRKTLEKIRAAGKPEPDFRPDDSKTFELFQSGALLGVFQMTSDSMRKLVKKMLPGCLGDLMVTAALHRPGPLNSGMVDHFLKRRNGKEKVSYFGLDEKLRPILEETCGVIVYQEQVMGIAQAVAGFTAAEADALRSAMSKKKTDIMEEKKESFVSGAAKNGVSQEKATELFGMMAKFAEYGFNKSHAAAYALMIFRTAYLKANYPLEFLAACCETTDENINLTPRSIAAECKRLGIDKRSLPTQCDMTAFGEHPLAAYGEKDADVTDISEVKPGETLKVRVYVENVYKTKTRKGKNPGQEMGVGKVSDETGDLKFVSFPDAWSIAKIKKGRCYNIIGDIEIRDDEMQVVVEKVEEIKKKASQPA